MNHFYVDENALATKVSRCYSYERSLIESYLDHKSYVLPECWMIGMPKTPSAKGDTIWHKLIRFCRSQRIDAIRFVRWALSPHVIMMDAPPEPTDLLRKEAMETYRRDLVRQDKEARLDMLHDRQLSLTHFKVLQSYDEPPAEAWALVLTDDSLELTPLFRYCVAKTLGGRRFREIARIFLAEALVQYHLCPATYDKAFREFRLCLTDFPVMSECYYDRLLADHSRSVEKHRIRKGDGA